MTTKKFKVTPITLKELDTVIGIVADALTIPEEGRKRIIKAMKKDGWKSIRAVRSGNKIVGGSLIMDFGHFFGGEAVRSAGITLVGISPEHRRTGACSFMVDEIIRETHRKGIPISTLFPANASLYRKSGFEFAMAWARTEIDLTDISIRNMDCEMVKYEGKKATEIKKLYRKYSLQMNGGIDRSDSLWQRILEPSWRGNPVKYLVKNDGKVTGYIIYTTSHDERELTIFDYVALDRETAERLLTFIADHSSQLKKAVFYGHEDDPMLQLLPERRYEIKKRFDCMMRIISVPGALKSRGYSKGIDAEVHFDIRDDLIAENNGKFSIGVKNGKAHVEKGGRGDVRIDIRSFAQLFTGLRSPAELALIGRIEGTSEELEKAGAIFSGPKPWLRDVF